MTPHEEALEAAAYLAEGIVFFTDEDQSVADRQSVEAVVMAYLEARAENDKVSPLAPIIGARTLLADFGEAQ